MATFAELTDRLRGLSGMFSPLVDPEGGAVASLLGGVYPAVLAGVLLAGLTAAAALAARRVLRLKALIDGAVSFRRCGRVTILVSDRTSIPFSTAIFGRAHVVLPVGLLHDPLLLRVTVRHELQHYRRRDPLWSVFLELFRIVYFWNPAAYGWSRELSDLQELACDEEVIRRGVPADQYGNCLLRVAELAVARRVVASTAMATISDRGAHLRRRIDMLFRETTGAGSRRFAVLLTMGCSLLLVLTATTVAAGWPGSSLPVLASGVTAGAHQDHDHDCEPSDCNPVPEARVAEVLPDLQFRSPDGDTVSLSSLQGKVVVVEFWAAWCKFCQREVTQMKALHERLAGTDFSMVGVSLSRTPEETQEFIEEHAVRWPQLHAEGGWKSEAGKAFDVKGVPARYLIDRSGQVTQLPRGNPEGMARMILDAIEGRTVITAVAR